MKKLSNAIFGKESRYHDERSGEIIESEKHFHPGYEQAPVSTGLPALSSEQYGSIGLEEHRRHHLHHTGFISHKETCLDCKTFHGQKSCLYCQPQYYYSGCAECERLRAAGLILPVWGAATIAPLSQDIYGGGITKGPLNVGGQVLQPLASVTQPLPTAFAPEDVVVENRARPAVIHEKVIPVEREEIQPVIHREREKTEIVQIEAPVYESEIRPTMIHEKQLPSEIRPQIVAPTTEAELRMKEFHALHQSTLERVPAEHRVIEKTPIIEEHIKKTVIEEVQPVIHKEVVEPHIIREVKPIYEKIVEPPVVTKLVKEISGLNLDEHYRHHSHHRLILSGGQECLSCRNYHQLPEACQLCNPLHFYEGCLDCTKMRESGINLPPFPGARYSGGYPVQTGLAQPGYVAPTGYVGPQHAARAYSGTVPTQPLGQPLQQPLGQQPLGQPLVGQALNEPITVTSTTYISPTTGTSIAPTTTYVTPGTTTGFKEGPAATTVSQKRTDPSLKSM